MIRGAHLPITDTTLEFGCLSAVPFLKELIHIHTRYNRRQVAWGPIYFFDFFNFAYRDYAVVQKHPLTRPTQY